MPNPARNVSIGVVGSSHVNGLVGLAYVITPLYFSSPIDQVLNSSTGFPFMQISLDATDSATDTILISMSITLTALGVTDAGGSGANERWIQRTAFLEWMSRSSRVSRTRARLTRSWPEILQQVMAQLDPSIPG
jgi:hypothetical protein